MITLNTKRRIYTSIVLLLIIILSFIYNFFLFYLLLVFGAISILEFLSLSKRTIKKNYLLIIINILFISYISAFSLIFFYFTNFIELKIIIFSLLMTCICSDIGGFIVGKKFKGPKLSKISPNKTISGAMGSLIFAGLVFSILIFFFVGFFNYKFLALGIITSIACQIGDLFFSYLKRKAKIKDTGNILPGHGGVLDRLDGILLGIPVGLVFLKILF